MIKPSKVVLILNLVVILLVASNCAQAALIIQLDASDGSTVLTTGAVPAADGQSVLTWVDTIALSGTQSASPTTTPKPTYNMTGGPLGQPVIDFSAQNANLATGSTQARTVVLVHRWDVGTGNFQHLVDARTGISNSFINHNNGIGSNWTAFVNDSVTSAGVSNLRSGVWQITTLVGTSTGSDELYLYSRFTTAELGRGLLAEVRVFNTALSESERLAVVEELNQKWFVVVPEPQSLMLALIGLASMGLGLGWRKSTVRFCR